MKARHGILYVGLFFFLALSGTLSGCAKPEGTMTAGVQDGGWKSYAIRGQAFENCVGSPVVAAAPVKSSSARYAKAKPKKKGKGKVRTAAKPSVAPAPDSLLQPDLICPPGCVSASRIHPAIAVPQTGAQTAPQTAPQAVPQAPPPAQTQPQIAPLSSSPSAVSGSAGPPGTAAPPGAVAPSSHLMPVPSPATPGASVSPRADSPASSLSLQPVPAALQPVPAALPGASVKFDAPPPAISVP